MRVRLVLALLFLSAPAAAQSTLTGNWSGTYAFSIQLSSCQNKTFSWSGNVSAVLLQTGNAVFARIDLANYKLIDNNCNTSVSEVTRVMDGTVDGTTLLLTVPNSSSGFQLTSSLSGDTITAQASNVVGLTGSLNLSRAKGDPPAASVTGSWSGNYSFTDRCPNGASKAYTGTFALALAQSGSNASGVVTMTGVPLYDQNCSEITTLTVVLSIAGSVSGPTFSGVAFDPYGSFDFPFSATIGGAAMNGTAAGASDTGTAGTFTLTQSDSQTPASDFSGRFDGSYNESDNEAPFCFNLGTLTFSGDASVAMVQAGNAVSGIVILQDALDIVSNGFGGCAVVNAGEVVLPFYGTLSAGKLSNTIPLSNGAAGHYDVDLANDSISGTLIDSIGDAMSFSTTRTVSAPAPSVGTFQAAPAAIFAGQSATLSWSTTNATSVSIDHGIGAQSPAGTVTVTPSQTTVYTLTATGPGGTATAQTTVAVSPNTPRKRPAKP